jgi:hypothetical protein
VILSDDGEIEGVGRKMELMLVLCPKSQSNIDGFIFYSCIGGFYYFVP